MRITGIKLFNRNVEFDDAGSPLELPVHLSAGMEIPYNANMVTFTFATMEFAAPELHEYRYHLAGFDKDWINAGTTNSAVYTNLDPGTYTFQVRGRNRDGIWAENGTSFSLTVLPPWWKTWWAYVAYALLAVVTLITYIRWRERALMARQKELEVKVDEATVVIQNQKEKVELQRDEIDQARRRSDELLLNILPGQVADELKAKGSAEAVQIDQVTVLFTDFKGFTAMSETLSPQELVRDLNECFSAFDKITEKYGIEKIKTIGDAYMAAGGLPTPNNTHATDVINAALEMRDFISDGKSRKVAAGLPYFEIRIGIHTGPVVAGIVGVKKFQYDIWGDTVNTASRMESSGEVGMVNISEATYALVKDVRKVNGDTRMANGEEGASHSPAPIHHSPELAFHFTPRGKVQAKGKGEMEMYFVAKG